MEEVGVYVFVGFLDAGKTTFINGAMQHEDMQTGERTAILVFEEGEEEYEQKKFPYADIMILSKEDMTESRLTELQNRGNYERIFIEYNGMWNVGDLLDVMPENWAIYQLMCIFDATTVFAYNNNMRQLVFDKIQYADLIVFNRYKSGEDKMPYHKLVRSIARNNMIVYENEKHEAEEDDIVDPLPFDMTARIVNIEDKDYAYFYRELSENVQIFNGKTVRFLGLVSYDKTLGNNTIIIGRHIMTCCAADTRYGGIVCKHSGGRRFKTGDWVYVTGKIIITDHKLYGGEGPVLIANQFELAKEPPEDEIICTFY